MAVIIPRSGDDNLNKLMYRRRSVGVFILPAFLIYFLIIIIPVFVTIYFGFFKWNGMGAMKFLGVSNFSDIIFKDKDFHKAIINSFYLAGASLFIQLPISFILAVVLARGVKFEKFFRTVYFIPVVISTMVIGQLFLKLLNADNGLLNIFLRHIGLGKYAMAWVGDEKTAFWATVIPAVWQYIGYHMLIMYAGIKSIPTELYEAARIDGASQLQTTFKITIPLLMPVIKICVTFALIGSLKAFDYIFIITRGGPFHSSEVPATLMYTNLFGKSAYGYGSAQAVFIIVECLVFSLIVNKIFKRYEDAAAAV